MRTISLRFRSNTWRCMVAAGLMLPAAAASAQSQARDMDPATEQAIRAILGPVGQAKFIGSGGFLDYEHPTPASDGPLTQLFIPTADAPEPPETLLPYQSRGQRIAINWAFLDSLVDGHEARASLPLFDGQEWELVFSHSEYRSATRYSWFGQIAGVATSDFNLVRHDDVVYMIIHDYERKKEFEIQFSPGHDGLPAAHVLRKTGDIRPSDQCGTCGNVTSPPDEAPHTAPADGYSGRSAADPTNIIDVMILCTVQARAAYGSDNAFYAEAQACIDDANTRNNNSGTGVTLRLMYASPTDAAYNEDASGSVDLERLATAPDGYMDTVQTLRDTYRADLVALIRQSRWGCTGTSCTYGVGYRPSSTPTSIYGFTVSCREGGGVARTFSHEVGHNLGACHDAGHGGCGSNPEPTAITASPYGYVRTCDIIICTLAWDTTMAYNSNGACGGSTPIPYYSNPNVNFDPPGACTEYPIGDAQSNVAGLINISRSSVSQFRIASTQQWAWWGNATGGNGTRHSPFGLVRSAVSTVQGGTAEGVVQVFSGTYDETATTGGAIVLTNPCRLQSADGAAVLVR